MPPEPASPEKGSSSVSGWKPGLGSKQGLTKGIAVVLGAYGGIAEAAEGVVPDRPP